MTLSNGTTKVIIFLLMVHLAFSQYVLNGVSADNEALIEINRELMDNCGLDY